MSRSASLPRLTYLITAWASLRTLLVKRELCVGIRGTGILSKYNYFNIFSDALFLLFLKKLLNIIECRIS
jgi:hypothetical protein